MPMKLLDRIILAYKIIFKKYTSSNRFRCWWVWRGKDESIMVTFDKVSFHRRHIDMRVTVEEFMTDHYIKDKEAFLECLNECAKPHVFYRGSLVPYQDLNDIWLYSQFKREDVVLPTIHSERY